MKTSSKHPEKLELASCYNRYENNDDAGKNGYAPLTIKKIPPPGEKSRWMDAPPSSVRCMFILQFVSGLCVAVVGNEEIRSTIMSKYTLLSFKFVWIVPADACKHVSGWKCRQERLNRPFLKVVGRIHGIFHYHISIRVAPSMK